MKSLMIVNEFVWPDTGIGKKILNQVLELRKLVGDCALVRLDRRDGECVRIVDNQVVDTFGDIRTGHRKSQYQWGGLLDYIAYREVEFVYIRYTHFANWAFNDFLKQCKRMGVKIVLEMPTYPYDSERVSWFSTTGVKLAIERIYRNKMHKYVDYVATFSDDEEIFGIPCIQISNAVDAKTNPVTPVPSRSDGIHFVAVANLGFWHGYDRMIRSLGDYYRSPFRHERVVFHLVGDGPGLAEYVALAKQEGVEDYVRFHGKKSGSELDSIFSIAHIGVDSLGRHRSGNATNNSLKSKEYAMRGLPFIKSHSDPSVDGKPFQHTVSPDEKNFSIAEILSWYSFQHINRAALRRYAEAHFTWRPQMVKVVNHVRTEDVPRKVA